jgi:hypothetical protein
MLPLALLGFRTVCSAAALKNMKESSAVAVSRQVCSDIGGG